MLSFAIMKYTYIYYKKLKLTNIIYTWTIHGTIHS